MNKKETSIEKQPLMVTIQCITYNHESYIRQCLEGFVMQKTNFRFEAVVHDDASTDGTAVIIREYAEKYPNIIKPIFEIENQYSKHDGSITRIMNEHTHGKYVAMCEGDDFWTDPYKLQKQVDFLESHPNYGLVHTYFNYVNTEDQIIPPPTLFHEQLQSRIFDGYIWDYYFENGGFILTCTCMYRNSLFHQNEQTLFDCGLFMMIARQSKTYCIREITSSYRRNPTGAMCTASQYYSNLQKRVKLYQIYYYFNGFPCNSYYKKDKVATYIKFVFTRYLLYYYQLEEIEKKIIRNIIKNNPSILLTIPSSTIKLICRKIRKLYKK